MTVHQVRFNWLMGSQEVKNVQYYDLDGVTSADYQTFADQIYSIFDANIGASLSSQASLQNLTLRPLDGGPKFSFDQVFSAGPLVGTNSSDLFDLTSPLQAYYRSMTAPPNKGWVKYSGFTEGAWDGDGWNATLIASVQSMVEFLAFGFGIPSGNAILGICRPDLTANTVIAFNLINSVVVRPYSRKQTSRRPR